MHDTMVCLSIESMEHLGCINYLVTIHLLFSALGLHMKTQTDLADAKTLVASCQDMCPEKEIYQRVYQRRVHVYEMIPGSDQVQFVEITHYSLIFTY